jgi:DNA-binding XRE family transcriptional regulator
MTQKTEQDETTAAFDWAKFFKLTGLTRQTLADRLDVSYQTVWRAERSGKAEKLMLWALRGILADMRK